MHARPLIKTLLCACLITAAFISSLQARASVVVAGTRVVYNQADQEVTVKLSNVGKSPALVQVWIDKGDPKAAPSTIDVPFIVTPPVSRIDPGKGQTLRIMSTGAPEIQDRESVFWLNVLEIPPEASGDDANKLQFAFRTRIKLFYRPTGLNGRPEDAPAQIAWHLTQSNGHVALEAHNPSAYSVSFSKLDVTDGRNTASFTDGDMIPPGATKNFPLTGAHSMASPAEVHYESINDYGGAVKGESALH